MTMKWMQGIKKIAAALLLALVFATSMVTSAHAEESASTAAEHIVLTVDSADMRVDGEDVSIADGVPVLNGGRVYVPLRAVAETFGAEVNYDGVTGDVTITTAENEVIMNTLASVYTVNGTLKWMDMAPYINSASRTMVPVRFIADALGFGVAVDYNADGTTRAVTFTAK